MKISSGSNVRMTVKRSVTVQDGPAVPMTYSTTGKQFRVERIAVEYTWRDGEWIVSSSFAVDLVGHILKKDGEPSKNQHSGHPDWDYQKRETIGQYAFAQKIIDLLRPTGDLTMSVFLEYEVTD